MLNNFFLKQFKDIKTGGFKIGKHKFILLNKFICNKIIYFPFYFIAIFFVIIIRLLRPIILIRIGYIISSSIGHYAGNTELYLCEKDFGINVPNVRYYDIFYFRYQPISNIFLAEKIKKIIPIYPKYILEPILYLNRFLPGFRKFEVGQNTLNDRDVNNLLDRSKIHLKFTKEEIEYGDRLLGILGIPKNSKIVCLLVRDSSYLFTKFGPGYEYHNYRDCNVNNYLEAAEELSKLGYFIVRMGEVAKEKFESNNPKIIDYANNVNRSPFLDIYLGYKCIFTISTSSGWDAVPSHLFKKPMLYTNYSPIILMSSFSKKYLITIKKYFDLNNNKILNFSEIYSRNLFYLTKDIDYNYNNIKLIENTPEEIKNAALDMHNLITNKLILSTEDQILQKRFWTDFPNEVKSSYFQKKSLHGEIKALISPSFLRNNKTLLH
jgi:putative glycosyltransferase (TIGR04372 family)